MTDKLRVEEIAKDFCKFKLEGVSEEVETTFKAEPPFKETPEPYFGFMGVLLRHKIKDKIQCHMCGEWFDFLPTHIRIGHKMKVVEYRKQFGLPLHFPLCSKSFSEKSRQGLIKTIERHGHPSKIKPKADRLKNLNSMKAKLNHAYAYKSDSYANRYAACFDQLRSRFLVVADIVGHEPSKRDIESNDKSLYSQIWRRYGSLNKFRKLIGVETVDREKEVSNESIFSKMIQFQRTHNRNPRPYDFASGTVNRVTIMRRFGSWNKALHMAGLVA